jgi:hypothetical protein
MINIPQVRSSDDIFQLHNEPFAVDQLISATSSRAFTGLELGRNKTGDWRIEDVLNQGR